MILRNRRRTLKTVKNLDAFPKISQEYLQPSTATDGTISLLSFGIMIFLIVWECVYYAVLDTSLHFKFEADTDFQEKLQFNLDLTVAMPCGLIGADILDVTGQHVMNFEELAMDDTWFEMDNQQLMHFQGIQRVNSYLREQFHSVHRVLWRNGYINIFGNAPPRQFSPDRKKDACRVHGSVSLNKVAGNFHITAGKSIPLPRGHAHLAVFMDDSDYNFTHRIERLSFGAPAPGIIHPLEGDEKISDTHMMSFQYFVTVVPTDVNTYQHFGRSFQYSVTELQREISHSGGSHGTPGIFLKYDVSALRVKVREEHEPFLQFLTRLVGIVGGVYTCSGLIRRLSLFLLNCVTCHYVKSSWQSFVGLFSSKLVLVPAEHGTFQECQKKGIVSSQISSLTFSQPMSQPLLVPVPEVESHNGVYKSREVES